LVGLAFLGGTVAKLSKEYFSGGTDSTRTDTA
jgi:hypothetical protein